MDITPPSSAPVAAGNPPQPATPSVSAPIAPVAPGTPTPPEMFEVKVNGKTVKMTRDEVIAQAQMGHAAQSRFQEAAQMKREAERLHQMVKKDPIKAIADPSLGLTKEQIRESLERYYMEEYIDPTTLTPEQLRAKQMEAELNTFKQERKERFEREQKEQLDRATRTQQEYYQKHIIDSLEKSNLPSKDPFMAQRMAFYLKESLSNGWDAPVDLIVSQVKREGQQMVRNMMHHSTPEQAEEMLGPEFVAKLMKYKLEQIRAKRQAPPPQLVSPSSPHTRERITMNDVNDRLREIRTGKRSW